MKIKLCCVLIFGAIIFGIGNGVPLNSDAEEVRKIGEKASRYLYDFYDTVLKFALSDSNETWASRHDVANKLWDKFHILEEIEVPENKSKNEELNSFAYNFDKTILAIFKEEKKFKNVYLPPVGSLSTVKRYSETNNIERIRSYKNESMKLPYFPDVQHIFETSNDPEEMKYYWNAWVELNSDMEPVMSSFFRKRYSDDNESDNTDFNMTQMDAVMLQIEPLYRQLHGFIRHQLNKKYGDAVINTKGPIPDHLFQQVLAQAWTNGSIIDEYFPYKDLPQYDTILPKNNYDTMKLFKMASKFYESMGLEAIPESYWGTRLKIPSCEGDYDYSSANILSQTPNVYMEVCHKMNFTTFLLAHGYMAQIHFALEKTHLPAYYFRTYNLDLAVGEAVILSASSPKHLSTVGLITDFESTEEIVMNRLMRLSIHNILNIPLHYVRTVLTANILEGKVKMSELNKHYWELMDKYVGVGPPCDRGNRTIDVSTTFFNKFHIEEQPIKFTSEVLSYQFFKKLCSIAGQYPKENLQNCDIYGKTNAGDALKKMIKLGSSKPLRDVLATMLPEDPTLNAESLLEYYSPVSSWLTGINEQNKVNMGWTHSDKNIESFDFNCCCSCNVSYRSYEMCSTVCDPWLSSLVVDNLQPEKSVS